MLLNHFKTAWRNLTRHGNTTFINLAGLTIGMTAAVFLFMWARNEMTYNSYHPYAEDIYRIKTYLSVDKSETWVWETTPYLLGEEARKSVPEIDQLARLSPATYNEPAVKIGNEIYKEKAAAYVDDQWFDIFHHEFISGNVTSFKAHPFSVILTESAAQKYLGSVNVTGRMLRLDTTDYQIQGVVRDYSSNSSFRYDMYIPLAARRTDPSQRSNDDSWGNFNYLTFVRLKPGTEPRKTAKSLNKIMATNRKEANTDMRLQPLAALHFEDDLQSSSLPHGSQKMVNIFGGFGILLLVIASINYVNLTTARASTRLREVSIKKIIGAGKWHLFLQFIFESVLMSILASVLTIILVSALLPAFNSFTENHFTHPVLSLNFWKILFITIAASILLTGAYPAMVLSSFSPLSVFRGNTVLRIKDAVFRKGLVIVQFSFSVMLIIAAIVIYRQMQFISQHDSQFDKAQVMSFSIPYRLISKHDKEARKAFLASIKQRLINESSIEKASLMNGESVIDNHSMSSGNSDWEGRAHDFNPSISFFEVDTSFKSILNLRMQEGRWFMPDSPADKKNVVLNETAVKQLGIRVPAVGQRFISRGDTGVVIGVVKDFHFRSLREKIAPLAIKSQNGFASTYLVKVHPGQYQAAVKAAEAIWKEFIPGKPFEYRFVDEEFGRLYRSEQKASSLVRLFASLAVFISCLGLYGLTTFSAERRKKEVSIRKVLGASVTSLVRLMSKEFLVLVVLSIVIAIPTGWYLMNLWLKDFAYRIHLSWWIFVGAGILAVIVAFFTVSFQSIKAALVNPADSLKTQ